MCRWYFVVFVVDAIVEGGFEVKALLGFPVLAMAMLSSAVTFSKVLLLESPFNSTLREFSG